MTPPPGWTERQALEAQLSALTLAFGSGLWPRELLRGLFDTDPRLSQALLRGLADLGIRLDEGLMLLTRVAQMRLTAERRSMGPGYIGQAADQMPVWLIRAIREHDVRH